MISFESDYTTGAHPLILEKLMQTNNEQFPGYGCDRFCESARAKIGAACGCPAADVHFLVGGTQTNSVIIAAMLRGYEGVIAADTGHIGVHEAGAVEYTGHKVLTLPQHNGKISPDELSEYIETFYNDDNHEHMVFPGMVYISHPTEYGTLYAKSELTAIAGICHRHNIPLFLDGARLGYGLASLDTDVTLADISNLCDVFYIGGTKVGALFGEAVVFTKNNTPPHFMTTVKQHGALLAKGWLLGLQFDTLFTDGLYMKISRHAIDMAERLKNVFRKKGYRFYLESPTNQQFIILTKEQMAHLKSKFAFSFWEELKGGDTIVRFATSWATDEAGIQRLEEAL